MPCALHCSFSLLERSSCQIENSDCFALFLADYVGSNVSERSVREELAPPKFQRFRTDAHDTYVLQFNICYIRNDSNLESVVSRFVCTWTVFCVSMAECRRAFYHRLNVEC